MFRLGFRGFRVSRFRVSGIRGLGFQGFAVHDFRVSWIHDSGFHGFAVQGFLTCLGFRVSGFRIWDLGFRGLGLKFCL